MDLLGRTSRLTPSEVTQTYKGAKRITSSDDFAEYAKGFLDEDALLYAKEVLGNDADDTAQLKKIAQLVEDGSKKIGKKLSKEELKAGLDALWDDGGVEGALEAMERWSKGGGVTITKETNQFVEYVNRAGQEIRIPKQSRKTIDNTIASKLNSTNVGDQTEAKVAHFIKNDMGKELTDFRNKVKNSSKQTIGDIDCGMEDVLIEVKKSVSSVEEGQFEKYIDFDSSKYINVKNKKVVLYIDKPMENISAADHKKLQNIEKMGVTIVNGLEELKGVLE